MTAIMKQIGTTNRLFLADVYIFSQHPKHQKIAMVYNYVDRAIKLSDEKYHDENVQK